MSTTRLPVAMAPRTMKAKRAMKAMKAMTAKKGMKKKNKDNDSDLEIESAATERKRKEAEELLKVAGAKKRPAAAELYTCWNMARNARSEIDEENKRTVAYDSGDDEGGEDDSTKKGVTRAMKYIFDMYRDQFMTDEDKKIWDELKKSRGERGIQKRRDNLVAKYVPQTANYQEQFKQEWRVIRETSSGTKNKDEQAALGMEELFLLHTKFQGNKAALEECIRNDVLMKGEDGLLYWKTKAQKKAKIEKDEVKGKVKFDPKSAKEMLQIMNNVTKEMNSVDYDMDEVFQKFARLQKKPQAVLAYEPSDADMAMLQEAFDSVTRVTTAIKQLGRSMIANGRRNFYGEVVKRGVQLCAEIVPASSSIEQLMFQPKCELDKAEVIAAVAEIEVPYKNLLKFYNDLVKTSKGAIVDLGFGTPKIIKVKDKAMVQKIEIKAPK